MLRESEQCRRPQKGKIMKKASGRVISMARRDDPITSTRAAEAVSRRKWTLRQRVEDFARRCAHGFIDEEVGMLDPFAPESSLRKRRTELADENIILSTGETRRNSKGQDCIVWRHRDHVHNPPPQKAREKKLSRFAALQEENARLGAAIAGARAAGADEERAAVIAHLRDIDEFASRCYAGVIERGEHRA